MTTAFPSLTVKSDALPGMILAALSFALLTAVDTIFKLLAAGHPTYQILALNGIFAILPILGWVAVTGGVARLRTARLWRHLFRGGISVASAYAGIYAYGRLPLTDYYAIMFIGPLLVTALSALVLRETIDRARGFAILAGFLGVLVVTNPLHSSTGELNCSAADLALGRLAAFAAVFCYALSVLMIRHMRTRETNMTFSCYGYVASIGINMVLWLWPLHAAPPPMTTPELSQLVLSGTLSGIASIFMMTAYHRTPAALVAPFQYTQIIWGAVAGYLIWQHLPDVNLVLGAVIVAASGLFVIWREMRIREIVHPPIAEPASGPSRDPT